MKISKSKQELARIISENGVWSDGAEFAAQDKGGIVFFYGIKPTPHPRVDGWSFNGVMDGYWIACGNELPNWHQTILSREEYFHLYPAPDAKPEFCDSVMRSIPEPSDKPTIEQLAADYRNAKDYAERKRQEADDAKADADEALRKLEIAGEVIGIIVTSIAAKREPELVITDWRDLQIGDEVEAVVPNGGSVKDGELGVIVLTCEDNMWANFPSQRSYIYYKCHFERGDVKFIRRP